MDLNFLKKFEFKKILSFFDELAERIPESITSILKKVALGILGILAIIAIYYGIGIGKELAQQEGQELAKDTKTLFREEIEREYNRKRRDIRMPDTGRFLENDDSRKYEMKYDSDPVGELENAKPIGPGLDYVNEPKDLRSIQNSKEISLYPEDLKEIGGNPVIESNEIPGKYEETKERIPVANNSLIMPEDPILLKPKNNKEINIPTDKKPKDMESLTPSLKTLKEDKNVIEKQKNKKLPLAPIEE